MPLILKHEKNNILFTFLTCPILGQQANLAKISIIFWLKVALKQKEQQLKYLTKKENELNLQLISY